MNDLAWFLSRSTGIVATVLGVASLVVGMRFSARANGDRRRPNWWLDLHNWLGGLTLAFTGAHIVALLAASDLGITLQQVLVPGTSSAYDATGMLTGVLAFYGFVVVVASSWPRKRLPRRWWHLVHLLAVPATVLGGVHGLLVGSDATHPAFRGLLVVSAGLCVHPIVLRLWGRAARRPARAGRGPAAPAVAYAPAPTPFPPVPIPVSRTPRRETRPTGGR